MAEHVRVSNSRAIAQKKMASSVKILRYLYKDVDGREVSLQHRKAAREVNEIQNDAHLTYGEVNAQSFLQILALVDNFRKASSDSDRCQSKVFVDLGCGTGLAVLCAALSPNGFTKVYGIELVPGLTNEALRCQQNLMNLLKDPKTLRSSSANALKKSKIDESSVTSEAIRILSDHLVASDSKSMIVEAFANLLCKELGHKMYKALILKPHKSFIKYLKACSQFFLTENDTVIQVLANEMPLEVDANSNDDANSSSSSRGDGAVAAKLDPSDLQPYMNFMPEIVFETNDIFEVDWHQEADVVYAASLLFSEDMMIELSNRVHHMKSGSYFINLKELPDITLSSNDSETRRVELVSESFFKMSWQMAQVYIYRVI